MFEFLSAHIYRSPRNACFQEHFQSPSPFLRSLAFICFLVFFWFFSLMFSVGTQSSVALVRPVNSWQMGPCKNSARARLASLSWLTPSRTIVARKGREKKGTLGNVNCFFFFFFPPTWPLSSRLAGLFLLVTYSDNAYCSPSVESRCTVNECIKIELNSRVLRSNIYLGLILTYAVVRGSGLNLTTWIFFDGRLNVTTRAFLHFAPIASINTNISVTSFYVGGADSPERKERW